MRRAVSCAVGSACGRFTPAHPKLKNCPTDFVVYMRLACVAACIAYAHAYCQPIAHPMRLTPGTELKQALIDYVSAHALSSAYISTCVGSVSASSLRMASCSDPDSAAAHVRDYAGNREIVSMVGTVARDGAHIHVSLSDEQGAVVGGHLLSARVFTTAEVVLHELPCAQFSRKHDPATGFKELVVERSRRGIKGGLAGIAARVVRAARELI